MPVADPVTSATFPASLPDDMCVAPSLAAGFKPRAPTR
jgi:hypothetical protein